MIWAQMMFKEWLGIKSYCDTDVDLKFLGVLQDNFMTKYNKLDYQVQGAFHGLVHNYMRET